MGYNYWSHTAYVYMRVRACCPGVTQSMRDLAEVQHVRQPVLAPHCHSMMVVRLPGG